MGSHFFTLLMFCSVCKYRLFSDKWASLSYIKEDMLGSFLHLFPPCLHAIIILNVQNWSVS